MTGQSFGLTDHDSLQFHFFDGSTGVAMGLRLFKTPTLHHTSAWLWHAGEMQEVFQLNGAVESFSNDHVALRAEGFVLKTDGAETTLRLQEANLHLNLTMRTELRWPDTISDVIHLPDMTGTLRLGSETFTGIGYCKRYGWTPAPPHWGYRFIQGTCPDAHLQFWTAEATFGTRKYDYFKIIDRNGRVQEASPTSSRHRQDAAYAEIDGRPLSVTLKEQGVWETRLTSTAMDSQYRQRICQSELRWGDESYTGLAINETCYGTLG